LKFRRLSIALLFGIGLVIFSLTATTYRPIQAQATCDRYVLGIDASDSTDCSDAHHPCRTIQYAIDQAIDGDTICVAKHSLAGPLTYNETLAITKSIALDGAWDAMCVDPSNLTCSFSAIPCDPANVTIDAEGTGRVISITGDITPTIDCFTITGGDADGQGGAPSGSNVGGGIYAKDAAPIIVNNVITGNFGCDFCTAFLGHGGGIYLLNAPATSIVSGNVIANNMGNNAAWGRGGGILLEDSNARILHNTIRDNQAGLSAGDGGGIAVLNGSPLIADNNILFNAAGTGVMCNGGGIFVWSSTPTTIEHNLIQGNRAMNDPAATALMPGRGGGIFYSGWPTGTAIIRDNTVLANVGAMRAVGLGGGMYLSGLDAASNISGNTVDDCNASFGFEGYGGGLYLNDSTADVTGNTVTLNIAAPGDATGGHGDGGGIYVNGGNGLVAGNTISGNIGFVGVNNGLGRGGGMVISNSLVTVQNNQIVRNTAATAPSAAGAGGGVWVYQGAPQILANEVLSNSTGGGLIGTGGGFYLESASPDVERNTIRGNRAIGGLWSRGGGVRIAFSPAFTLTNNIIARNEARERGSGVAIAATSLGTLIHNTIADNANGDGIGVYVNSNSQVTLYNNIIISHTVGITNADVGNATVGAKYTLFEGNATNYGAGVTSTDEVAGPAALLADYHLGSGSGAINHAVSLSGVTDDIDGDPRPIGPAPDVGADEVWLRVYLPLVVRQYP